MIITNNTKYNDWTVLLCLKNDKIMHSTYTSGFHLLEELLPDFWPVCCDSDGDVLQVSLHHALGGGTRARDTLHYSARSRTRRETRTNASYRSLCVSVIYICHFIPSFCVVWNEQFFLQGLHYGPLFRVTLQTFYLISEKWNHN